MDFINVKTKHHIIHVKPGMYSFRGLNIIGSIDDLIEYYKKNFLELSKIYPKGTKFNDILYEPFSDIKFLLDNAELEISNCSNDNTCSFDKCSDNSGSIIETSGNNTDVESLSDNQINSLCNFTFYGLFVKCKIIKIIDGDTFDIVFFAPIKNFTYLRTKKGYPVIIPNNVVQSSTLSNQFGFFVKIRCRCYGYDSPEISTDDGKIAKDYISKKIISQNYIFWVTIMNEDKYGRHLCIFYYNQNKKESLNTYLFDISKDFGRPLAKTYLGGHKD